MYASRPWAILIALPLTACPVEDKENDTLFSTLTATDTDPTDPGTSAVTNSSTTPDESSSGDDGTSGSEGETASQGECGEGFCAQPVPEGWFGPVVRWDNDGSMPPLCGEDWPDDAFTLMGGYEDPGPASCSCACGLTVSSVCGSYAYSYTDGACTTGFGMLTAAQACNEVDIADGSSIYAYAYTQGTPTCNDEVTMELAEATWTQEVRGCRGAEFGAECSGGGQCLPKTPPGFDNWLCIFSEGDMECPGGDYSEKTLLYSGVADSRACAPCICGAAPAATCAGNFEFFGTDDCTGDPVSTLAIGGSDYCADALTGVASFNIALAGGTECPIMMDTAPTGTIEPDGAITYCCTAP